MAAKQNEGPMRELWEAFAEDLIIVKCGLCGESLKQSTARATVALDCATGCASTRRKAVQVEMRC